MPGVRKGDIECTIEARRVALKIRGAAVLCGQFEDAIRRSESMWTISSGDAAGPQVVLSLEKTRKTWWKSAVMGHPEIDTTKVCMVALLRRFCVYVCFIIDPLLGGFDTKHR